MDENSEEAYELAKLLQDMALEAYPNPERIDCPGPRALDELADSTSPSTHPDFDHVTRCSPCLGELLNQKRIRHIAARGTRTRTAVFAATFAVLAAGGWFAWRDYRLSADLDVERLESRKHQRKTASLQQQLEALKETQAESLPTSTSGGPSGSEPVIPLALSPGRFRSAGTKAQLESIVIPARPARIIFLFQLDRAGFPTYELVLKTTDGIELRRITGLHDQEIKNDGRAVSAALPSAFFTDGSYLADLTGVDSAGKRTVEEYGFAVARAPVADARK
jgi:hypothetical protein